MSNNFQDDSRSTFEIIQLACNEKGGIMAFAHVRGGGEKGEIVVSRWISTN